MFGEVRRGSAMFGEVRRGSAMLSDVIRCSAMFGDVRRCSTMLSELQFTIVTEAVFWGEERCRLQKAVNGVGEGLPGRKLQRRASDTFGPLDILPLALQNKRRALLRPFGKVEGLWRYLSGFWEGFLSFR